MRPAFPLSICLCGLALSGCVNGEAAYSAVAVATRSPVPQVAGPFESVRLAEEYVACHPGSDFMVGIGNSMMPLYKDHTVVITEPLPMSQLKPGMTVVYLGDSGLPVAHVLVGRSSEGWIAMGVGNPECDQTRVCVGNFFGVVVKAYEPTRSPMLALLHDTPPIAAGAVIAWNP